MKRRGKRLTLGVIAVGLAVVLLLVIAHWGTVRGHVEAWHFQLTRATETIEPEASRGPSAGIHGTTYGRSMSLTIDKAYLQILASQLDGPIVFDQREMSIAVLSLPPGVSGFDVLKSHVVSGDSLQDLLLRCGYRIIEQRFPRRAYVVFRDAEARLDEEEDLRNILDELVPTKPGDSGT